MSTPVQAPQQLAPTPKPGWQSTEFGATILASAGMILNVIPAQYVPYVTILVAVYGAARTVLKVLHTMGYANAMPDLPALPAGTTQTTTTVVPKQ